MNSLTFRLALGLSSSVDEQIEQFKAQVLLEKEVCTKLESEIRNDLKPLILKTFGSHQLYTFGSMQSGLAIKGGDLDMYVELGSCKGSVSSKYGSGISAMTLANALRSDRKFGAIEPVPDARVPIVRMVHLPTKTKCDLSFSTALNIEQGHLLHYYLNLHPRFFDVMLVIKYWAKKHGICDGRFYIGSYVWNLFFISYLQTLKRSDGTKIVPSVLEMQADSVPCRVVQGCRVDFNPAFRHVDLPEDPKFSRLGLLSGFFTYYKNFCFRENIVCPYLGIPVSRRRYSSEFSPQIALHMANVRTYLNQGSGYRYFRFIQDPFDHKNFLVCRAENFATVTYRIAKAADLCERYMDMPTQATSRFLKTLFPYVL